MRREISAESSQEGLEKRILWLINKHTNGERKDGVHKHREKKG